MEIHDSVAQWMVAASYRIQALSRSLARNGLPQAETELSEIREAIDQSIKELRRVIVDLHPPALDELGLSEALHQNLQNFEPQRHRHFLSH
jgi:signal transduction histidine kinase